ncbi:MAG: stage III sporulation protein AE [Firmicutes bacterium]|nr:stage III sporulation protein AE [Bacillota bacterium]
MKRYIVIALTVICFVVALPVIAYADVLENLQDEVTNGLNNLDFSEVDKVGEDLVGDTADKVASIIDGDFDSSETFIQFLFAMFNDGLRDIIPELSAIFAVMVILGIARNTSGGIISQSTNDVVSFVGITVVLLSVLSMVVDAYRQVNEMLSKVAVLSEAAAPILLTLLIANGANAVSSVCQPSMVMFSSVVIKAVQTVVMPVSVFALVFAIVGNISSNVKINKMSSFMRSSSSWLLGVLFMVYSAFTSVQGISAGALDGVSYRAAKFATKSYIPILGGYLAEGFDVVVAGTSLIKNAFGAVSLLILLFLIAKPLVSVLCINLGLQAVSALSEPVVDGKYIKMLGDVGKTLTFLAVMILAVAFMFCIIMLIAINCANGV